jgi:hypothetical protein
MSEDVSRLTGGGPVPFPDSLCHRCSAPPRYVRTGRSTFILCPRSPNKYPAQPVRQCVAFTPPPPP